MELILLIIYSVIVWLIYFKFRLLDAYAPWPQAVLMAERGLISDGKSVSGLLRCRRFLAR